MTATQTIHLSAQVSAALLADTGWVEEGGGTESDALPNTITQFPLTLQAVYLVPSCHIGVVWEWEPMS